MNIGIDIDDTITDTYDMLIPLIAMHYDINLNKGNLNITVEKENTEDYSHNNSFSFDCRYRIFRKCIFW
mgnify:CR=1 FL=1